MHRYISWGCFTFNSELAQVFGTSFLACLKQGFRCVIATVGQELEVLRNGLGHVLMNWVAPTTVLQGIDHGGQRLRARWLSWALGV